MSTVSKLKRACFLQYMLCVLRPRRVLRAKNVFFSILPQIPIFSIPPTPFMGTLEPVLEVKPMPSMAPRTSTAVVVKVVVNVQFVQK